MAAPGRAPSSIASLCFPSEEAERRRAPVLLCLRSPRAFNRILSKLARQQILELELLLYAERQELVCGLARLERAGCALASANQGVKGA